MEIILAEKYFLSRIIYYFFGGENLYVLAVLQRHPTHMRCLSFMMGYIFSLQIGQSLGVMVSGMSDMSLRFCLPYLNIWVMSLLSFWLLIFQALPAFAEHYYTGIIHRVKIIIFLITAQADHSSSSSANCHISIRSRQTTSSHSVCFIVHTHSGAPFIISTASIGLCEGQSLHFIESSKIASPPPRR